MERLPMSNRDFREGTLAYDAGQNPNKPVIITDADKGTVSDQKPALRELIVDNGTNQAFPMDAETNCIEVQYLGMDGSGKTYTMPETRVAVPQIELGENDLGTAEYAAYSTVKTLFAETLRSDEIDLRRLIGVCEDAGISEAIVSAAAAEFSDELAELAGEP